MLADEVMHATTASDRARDATWNELLEQNGAALRRVASTYERDPALQDDLFQEICLAIWKALPSFREESSARTFAFRIAHNRGLSHGWRQSNRRGEDLEAVGPLRDPEPGPDAVAARRQRRRLLERAIRALPLGQRQVVTLSLEGIAQREIAEIIGITENNVAVRLHRAKQALARQMAPKETTR